MNRAPRPLFLVLGAIASGALRPAPARANLCDTTPTAAHTAAASQIESEAYSRGNDCRSWESCFIGARGYDASVIACNRKRDSLGDNLDKMSESRFSASLPTRIVRGHYNFFGFARKWYGYKLARQNGNWTATSVLDFRFPETEKDKLHIPVALTKLLSAGAGGAPLSQGVCATQATNDKDDGLVYAKDYPPPRYGARGCRVPRTANYYLLPNTTFADSSLAGQRRPVTEWLMLYWRDRIEARWSRADGSFKMKIEIANFAGRPGEITAASLKEVTDADAKFVVELEHNVNRLNNMYRPIEILGIEFYRAIYSGVSEWVIAHEFGHSLGLDDEYPQRESNVPGYRDCAELSGEKGNSNQRYLMCNVDDTAPKSVYYWLITQRYAVGDCQTDADCGSGYCDKGTLTIGRNHCANKKELGVACTRPEQCASGRCYLARCQAANECAEDRDCAPAEYCDKGTLTLGRNQCVAKKANGIGCTRAEQCTSGRCYAGTCKPQDACKEDVDCGGAKYCDTGTLTVGVNQCVDKRKNGDACTRAGQCLSGRCNALRCAEEKECSADRDCESGYYCDKGWLTIGKNECKKKGAEGQSCSRGEQCASSCCKLYNFKVQCRPASKCD